MHIYTCIKIMQRDNFGDTYCNWVLFLSLQICVFIHVWHELIVSWVLLGAAFPWDLSLSFLCVFDMPSAPRWWCPPNRWQRSRSAQEIEDFEETGIDKSCIGCVLGSWICSMLFKSNKLISKPNESKTTKVISANTGQDTSDVTKMSCQLPT